MKCRLLLSCWDEVDDTITDDAICVCIREIDFSNGGLDERSVAGIDLVFDAFSSRKHFLNLRSVTIHNKIIVLLPRIMYFIHVHPNDFARHTNFDRRLEDIEACTAAEVDDRLSFSKLSHRERITTA